MPIESLYEISITLLQDNTINESLSLMITTYGSCVTVSFTGILVTVLQVYCNYIPPLYCQIVYSYLFKKIHSLQNHDPHEIMWKVYKTVLLPKPSEIKDSKTKFLPSNTGMYWCSTMINVGSHSSQVCMFLTNCWCMKKDNFTLVETFMLYLEVFYEWRFLNKIKKLRFDLLFVGFFSEQFHCSIINDYH